MALRRFKWLSLNESLAHEEEARRLRVSDVARSNRGFMRAYEKAKGDPNAMARTLVPGIKRSSYWDKRRDEFVSRHLAQYKREGGQSRRRWLALVMWAYKPPGKPPNPHHLKQSARRVREGPKRGGR